MSKAQHRFPSSAYLSSIFATINRLSSWYTIYRLLIALSITLIFTINVNSLNSSYPYPSSYFYLTLFYSLSSLIQALLYHFYDYSGKQQLLLIFLTDAICLSGLIYFAGGPNLQLSLLYAIVVFSAAILLSSRYSLIVTLAAAISVIYQNIFELLLNSSTVSKLSNSVLLSLIFFGIYGIGQLVVQRFKLLENLTLLQNSQLQQLQNINHYILERIDSGYIVLDESYQVVLLNPAAQNLLGLENLDQYDGASLKQLLPDFFKALLYEQQQRHDSFHFQSDKMNCAVLVQIKPLITDQQQLHLLVLQDLQKITQRVQQMKLSALGQLSASIAHEIRNPLAAICQSNALLPGSDAEQRQFLISMIAKQADRINKIIEDTLGMARNENTQPTQILASSFVSQFIHEDLMDAEQQLQVQVQQDFSFYFDPYQLRQVLINLLRNAIRHTQPPGTSVSIRIHQLQQQGCIDIINHGKPIPPHTAAQLFQPFFSTELEGTGLGLYLSRTFCEANQATLNHVEQQHGTCFRIECPIIHP